MPRKQNVGTSSPFFRLTRHQQQANSEDTPLESVESLQRYNEWADPIGLSKHTAKHTVMSTELLMSRPFSALSALRHKQTEPDRTSALLPSSRSYWFADDEQHEPLIHWNGLKAITGGLYAVLMSLLGTPFTRQIQTPQKRQNLLARRRQSLRKQRAKIKTLQPEPSNTSEQAETVLQEEWTAFVLGFQPVSQPTLSHYGYLYPAHPLTSPQSIEIDTAENTSPPPS